MTDEIALPPSEPGEAPPVAPQETIASPAPRRSWPLLGPTLWVFGAAMWAYVTMGELATTYVSSAHMFLVGEGVAVLFVLGATGGAWWMAIRASLASAPARSTPRAISRGAGVALLAFLLWSFVTFVVSAFGLSSHHNLDGKITVCLLLLAGGATAGGRRLIGTDSSQKTPRQRSVARGLWIGVALITLVALIALVAD